MSKDTEFKEFNLIKACKDCPFKKTSTYLNGPRIQGIMDDIKNDRSFHCHKTITDRGYEKQEIEQEIDEELQVMIRDRCSHEEVLQRRIQLLEDPYYKEVLASYEESKNNQMYCAGALILAKKEGIIFDNAALRYAVYAKLLDLDQFIDEHEVYDSIKEAVAAHSKS